MREVNKLTSNFGDSVFDTWLRLGSLMQFFPSPLMVTKSQRLCDSVVKQLEEAEAGSWFSP